MPTPLVALAMATLVLAAARADATARSRRLCRDRVQACAFLDASGR